VRAGCAISPAGGEDLKLVLAPRNPLFSFSPFLSVSAAARSVKRDVIVPSESFAAFYKVTKGMYLN